MKRIIWLLLYLTGFHIVMRWYNRKRLTIVLYHGVDIARDNGSYNYRGKFIQPDSFARQLAYYKKHYTVLPLDEAIEKITSDTLPKNSLVITFDDGYQNNYTHAFPLLKKYKFPATIFLATDFVHEKKPLWVDRLEYSINTGNCAEGFSEKVSLDMQERKRLKYMSHKERIQALEDIETNCHATLTDFNGLGFVYAPLSFKQVKEMEQYAIMFGAHTKSHPILSKVPSDVVYKEITESLSILRKHTHAVSKIFAYPNGQPDDMNSDTITITKKAGFSAALTTSPGHNTKNTNPYLLKRFTLDKTDSHSLFVATVTGSRHLIISLINKYAKRS